MTITERDATAGEANGRSRTPGALLRRTQLSRFIDDAQLADLESFGRVVNRSGGLTLFRQDEEPTTLYLILRGSVELRAKPPGRRVYRTVEVVGPGCTVGDEALVGEGAYLSSARIQEASKMLAIGRHEFERLSSTRPDIALGLLRCAGSCLIQTVRRSAILTQAPAGVALGLLLQELSNEATENGRQGAVHITHAQLAGLLHLSRETVSRMLGQMAAQGLVELSRGTIRLRSS